MTSDVTMTIPGTTTLPEGTLPPLGYMFQSSGYDSAFYEEHKKAGIDYLAYGDWHRRYAAMVTEITVQDCYEQPMMLDGGCACGNVVRGFKDTGVYARVMGIDVSDHMIHLGQEHLGLTDTELLVGTLDRIPVADDTFTLVNTGQVLEHIEHAAIPAVLREFWRVLRPGGRMFHNLAALKRFNPPNLYLGDPTHINIKPVHYWAEQFQSAGFLVDIESYDRFVSHTLGPDPASPDNFFRAYPYWTSFTLIKPLAIRPMAKAPGHSLLSRLHRRLRGA